MIRRKIVCPFLCLLLWGCSASDVKQNENPLQEAGEHQQEIAVEDTYVKSIQYPKTEFAPINEKVRAIISEYEEAFVKQAKTMKEKQKPELNVTYEAYVKQDRYISIKLMIYELLYQKKEYIETLVYDTKQQAFQSIDDVLDEEGLRLLSARVIDHFRKQAGKNCENDQFRTHSAPIAENFSRFVLKKNALTIYFPEHTLFDIQVTYECPYDVLQESLTLPQEEQSVVVPYEDILNEPIKNIDPKKPMVAMTFDDGPSRRYTTAILDALKEYQANATFFVLGSNAQNAPDILQRMVLEGNEIGNHTFSHKQLTTLSRENIEEEITATQESIYAITHTYPNVIRPPYGSKNDVVMQCAQGKRIITWTLDTLDWKDRNTKVIVDRVMNTVKDGDIILMHDLYATSAQAAMILIPKLQENGYQLVTVSDLFAYRS